MFKWKEKAGRWAAAADGNMDENGGDDDDDDVQVNGKGR